MTVEVEDVVEVAREEVRAEHSLVLAVGPSDDGAYLGQVVVAAETDADLVRAGAAVGDGHGGVPLLGVLVGPCTTQRRPVFTRARVACATPAQAGSSASPRARTRAAASRRLCTSSFWKTAATWWSTVRVDSTRRSAI